MRRSKTRKELEEFGKEGGGEKTEVLDARVCINFSQQYFSQMIVEEEETHLEKKKN